MNLAEIVSQFESGEAGTDAYVELRAQCLPLIETDPANAAAYFLIANFARSYVMLYEEEAVTVEVARKAKTAMLDYLHRIVAAQGVRVRNVEARVLQPPAAPGEGGEVRGERVDARAHAAGAGPVRHPVPDERGRKHSCAG